MTPAAAAAAAAAPTRRRRRTVAPVERNVEKMNIGKQSTLSDFLHVEIEMALDEMDLEMASQHDRCQCGGWT